MAFFRRKGNHFIDLCLFFSSFFLKIGELNSMQQQETARDAFIFSDFFVKNRKK
jgi:hypothetical protein